jgi:hypothetical protein
MKIPAALERPSEQADGEAAVAADQERALAIAIGRATVARGRRVIECRSQRACSKVHTIIAVIEHVKIEIGT